MFCYFQFGGSDLFFSLNLWLYSFFLKLIPCLVLTVFTASLIRAMYQVLYIELYLLTFDWSLFLWAEAQSSKLKNGLRRSLNSEENKPIVSGRKRNTDRTTRLLIVILVLFLIAEFPIVSV